MKHFSHIYIARKAIEFLPSSIDNLVTRKGTRCRLSAQSMAHYRDTAKTLQRLMLAHQDAIVEASWAPDDVIADMARFHVFKLYRREMFSEGGEDYCEQVYGDGYCRGKGSGGAPFKVDHLAALTADLRKLRGYNDVFSLRQIHYLYVLISHYVADAHVPMHCDLRDDPPSAADKHKPGPVEFYFGARLHAAVEEMWERAVTPVALAERMIEAESYDDLVARNPLSDAIAFDLADAQHRNMIVPVRLAQDEIMDFMIERCIASYERSLAIWPPEPRGKEYGKDDLSPAMTREIFAAAISATISVWLAIVA